MEKGLLDDSLYFGTFAKASTLNPSKIVGYSYCPGPKPLLKLVENDENLSSIAQPLLDEKLVTLQTAKIAEACQVSSDLVANILASVRDEIADFVVIKKGNANIAFSFGTLYLRSAGTIEFKSQQNGTSADLTEKLDRIPHSDEFD